MGTLSRFAERAGAAVVAAVLVGCAAQPEPVATAPTRYSVAPVVASYPPGAWIEVDGGYVGTAPVRVEVETTSLWRPRRLVVMRATDMATGAWEEKRFYGARMPERVLFDLRPWLPPPVMIR